MKYLTILATITLTTTAYAEIPNSATMSWKEFVEASGCIVKDNAAGQSNLYSIDGGACDPDIQVSFTGNNGPDDTNGSTVPGL